LKKLFAEHGGGDIPVSLTERVGRLEFAPMKGFMRGFIDLVFQFEGRYYLLDWKSNFLGSKVEDYQKYRLAEVMQSHFYFLQYYIYSLALNQYLSVRLPDYDYEKHFGGVFYIFLRGVAPEMGPDYGIYHDRVSPEFMQTLQVSLIDHSQP
jgi:exodeoxyribonuclease V beta subunit